MSTWAASADDPFRHPWLSQPSLKRRHSDSSDEDISKGPDSDQDANPSFYPPSLPEIARFIDSDGEYVERKRRRCDTIERRMARMYIDGRNMTNSQSDAYRQGWQAPPLPSRNSNTSNTSYTYTAGSTSPIYQDTLLPQYAVEEPVSPEFKAGVSLGPTVEHLGEPDITEVRMKGAEPAWYEREKDRIVITDLDEAAEEAEKEEEEYKSEAEPHPDAAEHAESNADWSISTVLLDHIKKQANFPFVPPKSESKDNCGALVLFRPVSLPPFSVASPDKQNQREDSDGNDGVHIEEIDESEARLYTPSGDFAVGTVTTMDQEPEMTADEPMDMDVDVDM